MKQNQTPYLVPTELFPKIRSNVANNAEQLPQYGYLSSTGADQHGEYVFFLKPEYFKKKSDEINIIW